MTMRLTPDDLLLIAGKIRQLQDVGGVEVRQVKVGAHVVFLDQTHDQREGSQYFIVGITDKVPHNHEHPTRGGREAGRP